MTRIAVISNSLTYMARFRHELLLALQSAASDLVLLCPPDRYAPAPRELAVKWRNIPLEQHGMNALRELRTVGALARQLRELRPGLVINFTIKPALYGSVAAWLAGIPRTVTVFTGLGYWFTEERSRRGERITARAVRRGLRFALSRNELVFFQNTDDRDLFVSQRLVAKQATRIVDGSGVDIDYFAPRAHEPDSDSFLMIARLLEEKGVREYVAAARAVRARHPHARFRLLGGVDTSRSAIPRAELDRWIREGVIEYLGEVSDVRDHLAKAAVVVLPSYREGTPRSVLEALAMGKAVIVTDVPGCRETVQQGVNGLLVPARDAHGLARAMESLIGQVAKVRAFGSASRKLAEERYDVRRVNSSFLAQLHLA